MGDKEFKEILHEYEVDAAKAVYTKDFTKHQLRLIRQAQVAARARNNTGIKFSVHAETKVSGKTYDEEVIMLSKDFLDKIYGKVYIADEWELTAQDATCSINIVELDHEDRFVETEAIIHIEYLTDEEIIQADIDKYIDEHWDGVELSNYIFDFDSDVEDACINNLEDFVKNELVEVTVKIKRKQLEAFEAFMKTLNKE